MSKYPFNEIEPKWQKYWEEHKTFHTEEDPSVPKEKRRYILDMFPYPSGAGLHVGHPEGYTATDIYSRYLFEESVFRRRREGEISADELSDLMLDAQEKAYGDALGVKHRYMWAVKSHYYSADFSYYNYPYAFGLLLALSLYSMKDETGFDVTYRSLLGRTGSEEVLPLLRSVGIDAEDAGCHRLPWAFA